MGLSFTVMFPLGLVIIRIPNNKYAVYIHAGWQLLSWILMITGLVFGIRVGKIIDRVCGKYIAFYNLQSMRCEQGSLLIRINSYTTIRIPYSGP